MLSARIDALARRVPFRLAVAGLLLALHLLAARVDGAGALRAPIQRGARRGPRLRQPGARSHACALEPAGGLPLGLGALPRHRPARVLAVPQGRLPEDGSRPRRGDVRLPLLPGVPLPRRPRSLGGRIPADYALLGVSLVASFLFLFLWTGPAVVSGLGTRATYFALLAFNAFPSSFSLATIQTEPTALALTLGAFVALHHRRLVLGGLLAGATTAIRGPGLATAAAYALAVAVITIRERPQGARGWASPVAAVALSGWGLAAVMAVHLVYFHDPFILYNALSRTLGAPKVGALFPPSPETVLRSLDMPLHEGAWVVMVILWLALGHREAMRGFSPAARAYLGALAFLALGLGLYGSAMVTFASMNRYALLALPIFFAVGALTRRRPLALGIWVVACFWHYWQADLCFFVGDRGDRTLRACHTSHWIGRL